MADKPTLTAVDIHRAVIEFMRLAMTVERQLDNADPSRPMREDRKTLESLVGTLFRHQQSVMLHGGKPHVFRRIDLVSVRAFNEMVASLSAFRAGTRAPGATIDALTDTMVRYGAPIIREDVVDLVRNGGKGENAADHLNETSDEAELLESCIKKEPQGPRNAAVRLIDLYRQHFEDAPLASRSGSAVDKAARMFEDSGVDTAAELEFLARGTGAGGSPPLAYLLEEVLAHPPDRVTEALSALYRGRAVIEREGGR